MSTRKRPKYKRYPGTKTHGRGRKNRTRGSGNRGGVGWSGTGKRGDQKKTLIIKLYGNDYFGKDQRGAGLREKKKIPAISLSTIVARIPSFLREGVAKESKGSYEITLKECKIVGNDAINVKLIIHAKRASAGAIQAVERAGGSIVLPQK